MTTTIRISDKLKDELISIGSKEDTYEDIIQRNIQFTKKFSNEKQFAEWFEANFELLGFDKIIEKPVKCPDYIMLKGPIRVKVELETMSSNFILHKHDPKDVDLVICLLKNKDLPVQIIELSAFEYAPPETNKPKISCLIDKDLVDWLDSQIITKRFASRSHGIEYALTVLKTPQIKTKNIHPIIDGSNSEIITESSLSLEAMRQKWWNEKQIGLSILKAGGIGLININNIIQKNPDLFETKDECRVWLHNKFKTEPPLIKIEAPIISNKLRKSKALSTGEEPPKFTPNRHTTKCPGCGEEQLELPGSPIKKCANCGFNFGQDGNTKPNQIAPAQEPPPPPMGATLSKDDPARVEEAP
jgi:Arc/MetJ-type ribon-helix-helix transcriptional regulator